jgi:hypothetical protein
MLEECVVGTESIRRPERCALEPRHEVAVFRLLQRGLEVAGIDDPHRLIDGHQAAIKCGVMERIQAQAVPRIQAVRLVLRPWHDVAGPEERGNAEARRIAGVVPRRKDRASEEGLADALCRLGATLRSLLRRRLVERDLGGGLCKFIPAIGSLGPYLPVEL